MKQISQFYSLFWIIYFPTCIAYNDLPGFSSIDELMTVILIAFTWNKRHSIAVNREPLGEFLYFLGIYVIYIIYSLMMAVNTRHAVFLDMVQWIRPFSVIYCTWVLNPQFSARQKKWMLYSMIITLFSWIIIHPETTNFSEDSEFPVLGQMAICTGMAYYLFKTENTQTKRIALLLVLTGMLAPKFKFMGEVVCFVAIIFYLRKQLNLKSSKTVIWITILMVVVLMVTWTRFDGYYVKGWNDENLARPKMYRTSLLVLRDYFPFGPGMGTFGTNAAGVEYSPLFYKYGLNEVWGLDPECAAKGFAADAFYPALAQFGVVGILFFCVFWKRRIVMLNNIIDMKYYRVALMSFFCLAIEQTADTSFLSGKGMGYCMLLGLCLNANRNMKLQEENTALNDPNLEVGEKLDCVAIIEEKNGESTD